MVCEKATKESDRKLVVARLWGKLTGVARSVVKHLNPDAFEGEDGLRKFLDTLRQSPLQQLPVPDSFMRLEKWNQMKRLDGETIAALIVREEELFTELQQALTRARMDRGHDFDASPQRQEREPSASPAMSPTTGAVPGRRRTQDASGAVPQMSFYGSGTGSANMSDFFSDEMRGYRLLKASRLTNQERQNVLVQTANSTQFMPIRRALRTLFAEEDRMPIRGKGGIWWNDQYDAESNWVEAEDDWYDSTSYGDSAYDGSSVYWSEWDGWDWDQSNAGWDDSIWYHDDEPNMDDVPLADGDAAPEENQLKEAHALALEANRTLGEAKEAVRKTRQARGYFSPESSSGKGMTKSTPSSGSSFSGKGKSGKFGSGKGNNRFGPCFICGMQGHGYQQCPDRYSKGKGKSKFGKSKGKFSGKGKGKPSVNYYDINMNVFSVQWDEMTMDGRPNTWTILDTGATENAIGVDSLNDLVDGGCFSYTVDMSDLPVFRFGNGHSDKALSRVDLQGTSLGKLSFYVLGGMASRTPPLLGARTLREKNAMVCYKEGHFTYQDSIEQPRKIAKMQALRSGHIAIDLSGDRSEHVIKNSQEKVDGLPQTSSLMTSSVMMVVRRPDLSDRLQCLAQRLQGLQERREPQSHGEQGQSQERASVSRGRPKTQRVSMLGTAQDRPSEGQPTCQLEQLQPMRVEDVVHCQGQHGGQLPSDGTRPNSDPHLHGRTGSYYGSERGHRAGGEWEVDGSEGQAPADGDGSRHQCEHRLPGVLEPPEAPWPKDRSDTGPQAAIDGSSPNEQSSKWLSGRGHGGECIGDGECHASSELGGSSECKNPSRGADQEGEEAAKGQGCPGDCGDSFGNGGGSRVIGEEQEEDGSTPQRGERLMTLKKALAGLRARMGWQSAPEKTAQELCKGTCCSSPTTLVTTMVGANDVQSSTGEKADESTPVGTAFDTTMAGCTTMTSVTRHGVKSHSLDAMSTQYRHGVDSIPLDEREVSDKNILNSSSTWKISSKAAAIGAMLLMPLQGMFSQMSGSTDFCEVACAPTSKLAAEFESMGFEIKRINFKEGYDLDSRGGTRLLDLHMKTHPPRFNWISLPCTRLSALQNLTETIWWSGQILI